MPLEGHVWHRRRIAPSHRGRRRGDVEGPGWHREHVGAGRVGLAEVSELGSGERLPGQAERRNRIPSGRGRSGGGGGDRTFAFPNFSKVPHVRPPPSPKNFAPANLKIFQTSKPHTPTSPQIPFFSKLRLPPAMFFDRTPVLGQKGCRRTKGH